MVIKKDLKILRYVHRHRFVPLNKLLGKYGMRAQQLINRGYITYNRGTEKDEDGFPIDNHADDVPCRLTDLGISEVESRQWLDLQYVLTMIVVPIIVGVCSAVLTNLILSLR